MEEKSKNNDQMPPLVDQEQLEEARPVQLVLPGMELPEPEVVEPIRRKRASGKVLFCQFVIVIYILTALVSGYWYFARGVRSEQFENSYSWLKSITRIYEIPAPKDERW